jgi:hypothetical protein
MNVSDIYLFIYAYMIDQSVSHSVNHFVHPSKQTPKFYIHMRLVIEK